MPIKYVVRFCMAVCFLLSIQAGAQGITDSLQYRQAKLDVWCETIRFVYEDNSADSLKNKLNCRSWEAFQRSLESNHLQARTFFQSIEKPSIYRGYTSFDAKLQKLIDEIGIKLKSSPSRSIDPVRLRKVDSLQLSLQLLASTRPALSQPDETEEQVAENQEESINQPTNTTPVAVVESNQENITPLEEDPMDWTEIAQWLLLLLLTGAVAYLWVKNHQLQKELNQRMSRRKQEISAISRMKESLKPSPPKTNEPAPMSKPEVQSLVRAEIERVRQQQRNKQNLRQQQPSVNKPAEKQAEAKPAPLPQTQNEKPVGVVETPAVSEGKEEAKMDTGLYYDKLPFKGGFHQNQLSTHRAADSIYSIQVLSNKPDEAEFWVTEDQEVQKYAMQNGLSFFEEACDYNQVEENPSRVRNLEKGRLRKNGHLWEIEKKVRVNFE